MYFWKPGFYYWQQILFILFSEVKGSLLKFQKSTTCQSLNNQHWYMVPDEDSIPWKQWQWGAFVNSGSCAWRSSKQALWKHRKGWLWCGKQVKSVVPVFIGDSPKENWLFAFSLVAWMSCRAWGVLLQRRVPVASTHPYRAAMVQQITDLWNCQQSFDPWGLQGFLKVSQTKLKSHCHGGSY